MLKLFKKFTGREWGLTALTFLFIVAQVWLELTMPDYMSRITTLVQTEGSKMSEVLAAGGMMILCALGSLVAAIIAALCASGISASFSANLRHDLFRRVQDFSMEEIGHFSTASLITRSTNDVTQIQLIIVMGLQMFLKAPITVVGAIMKIMGKEWQWTMATAVAVVVLILMVGGCILITMPKFQALQTLTDDLNRVTRENLNGLRVVRAYNAEQYQEQKFSKANDNLTNTYLFAQRVMAFMSPCIQLIMSGLPLAVYWIGAVLISTAGTGEQLGLFSDMMVFSQYALQVVMSFMTLVMIFMQLPRSSVAARRINEVLETQPTILDGDAVTGVAGKEGEVEFRDVSFRYPDGDGNVLEHITFTAKKGETVALIGATGCGKSTVINLIPRFYDATEGEVLVDGINVRDYKQYDLRNRIGYVSQKAILFTGSIRSNVAFGDNGRPGSELNQGVADAVETAQAREFVDALPGNTEGFVAQGGGNLSGGQKQRISIARAICRKPEILIFDDSFSALDYKTDRILRHALNEKCRDATRLIVAQRIGTIRDADKIIVLEDGKIAGMGTHQELMKNCEVYRQIAFSQLTEKELA